MKTKKTVKKATKSEVVKKEAPKKEEAKKEESPELILESKPAEVVSIDANKVVKDSVSETPKVGVDEAESES